MNSLKTPPKDNQNQKNEGQTMQWPKEKGQKEKQRSIKHTHKTKDRGVTRMFMLFFKILLYMSSYYILQLFTCLVELQFTECSIKSFR